jgi:DNA-binding transcriptional MerR regulator
MPSEVQATEQTPIRLVSVTTACRRMGCSKHTLLTAIQRGSVVPFAVSQGGQRYFRSEQLASIQATLRT